MKSARHTLVSRLGRLVPTLALAAAGTVVAIVPTQSPDAAQPSAQPRSAPVDFTDRSPFGKLEHIVQVPGGVRASGYTVDPSTISKPVTVFSSVDRKWTNSTIANKARSDVAAKYPDAGSKHGYSLFVPASEGRHDICILAQNVGAGKNYTLGCLNDALLDYGPFGAIDAIDTRPGALHVKGWLVDDDQPSAAVTTVVTIDGVAHQLTANRSRPDIADVSKGAGSNHGFEGTYKAAQGSHTVCINGRNIGLGSNNRIGCKTLTLSDSPLGKVELVGQTGGSLRVRGWMLDRDQPTTALKGFVRVDGGRATNFTANATRTDIAKAQTGTGTKHGYDLRLAAAEGKHSVCVTARNLGYGKDTAFACKTVTLDYTPKAAIHTPTATRTGLRVTGWAEDPDTTKPVAVHISVDGRTAVTVTANGKGSTHNGHNFAANVASKSGKHTVCATAVNLVSGTRNSTPACRTITLALSPLGYFDSLGRSGDDVVVKGWAFDPDSTGAASVSMTVDGKAAGTFRATDRYDSVAAVYPSAGTHRGFNTVLNTDDGKHTVCVTAKNVGGGQDYSLGCKLIIAVNPVVPSAPRSVKATSGFGSSVVSWTPPASDGGAPPSSYTITASPGGKTMSAASTARSVTMTGLAVKTSYTFAVRAVNVAGTSPAGTSPTITTQAGPAPQTTPAPISTSRYIRNIRSCSTSEKAVMQRFGVADAKANPAGHRYLMLLDIGGQNQTYGGVVLSATTRFVTYANLLACSKSYVAGYASAQRSGAPAMIAIGVNNDMDVNTATGRDWAVKIVNPLMSFAKKYSGITIAGANDIEPGFSASYAATRNWVTGYLAATNAKFVFNGSADGCAWTVTNRSCNNGWTMSGLYNLAGGAASSRIINLPQVYNYTMADQWKYISLTGIGQGKARINFGGPLTEYTACAQARSCGSIGGVSAWKRMWSNLQSHPQLRVSSLPYATDLRIDS